MELKIEYLSKEELKPYANNAKIHTAEQVKQIKESIKEFGFNDPIAIWHDNEIIEGHGRLLAVMEMPEIETVPVIRLDGLTDEERKAYTLVHNKLTMNTGFDVELLSLEIDSINDIDLSKFGFEPEDDPYIPEPFDEDLMKQYDDHSDDFLLRRRVIITYAPEKEMQVCEWLGVEPDSMKVVYDFDELMGGGE